MPHLQESLDGRACQLFVSVFLLSEIEDSNHLIGIVKIAREVPIFCSLSDVVPKCHAKQAAYLFLTKPLEQIRLLPLQLLEYLATEPPGIKALLVQAPADLSQKGLVKIRSDETAKTLPVITLAEWRLLISVRVVERHFMLSQNRFVSHASSEHIEATE